MENQGAVTNSNKSYIQSLTIIGILFFIFGFVTWLNGTLIPFLKISCELNNFQAYFVTFAFYVSYFVFAIPSSWILHRTGFKNGMALGLVTMAIGSLLFIPAAHSRTFVLFLTGLFVQGAGLSILQTASNPYIVILGPIESAAKRISIMGICNKIAGVLSPLILGMIVLKNADSVKEQIAKATDATIRAGLLNDMAARVIVPYIIIAVCLVILAAMIRYSPLPDIDTDREEDHVNANHVQRTSVFQYPYMILGFITLFLYVGVEVMAGDTIILYGQSQKIPLAEARVFTSYTLVAMVVGYIISIIAIPKFISQSKALAIAATLGFIFTLCAILSSGFNSVLFIAALGLANAVMWPAIWPLAIEGLGKFTKIAAALLVMGIAGGATLPLLYGRLADKFSPQQAYWIMIPCYLMIFYYSIWGNKIGKRT